MTVIPESSGRVSYSLATRPSTCDYHPGSFIARSTPCRSWAALGLVEKWGQDKIQAHMAAALKSVRRRR